MLAAERKIRDAITSEISRYIPLGVTLSWRTSDRAGEAVLALGEAVERVYFSRSASKHDVAGVVGRVRRALRKIGADKAEAESMLQSSETIDLFPDLAEQPPTTRGSRSARLTNVDCSKATLLLMRHGQIKTGRYVYAKGWSDERIRVATKPNASLASIVRIRRALATIDRDLDGSVGAAVRAA
jgi:hypothetical protein